MSNQLVEIYTCSKCGRPNSCDPAKCCRDGDFHGGIKKIEIPIVKGRYYTKYFDDENSEVLGRMIRSSEVKKLFLEYIYTNQKQKIMELFNSLERVYTLYRENQIHNAECEYATGTSCSCWCGEKYHGLKGKGAEFVQK